ncbi:MAG: MFS transporter [Armatimonadetes bacterium]|nr:MFS transporter [Armatimonadota bacterium]
MARQDDSPQGNETGDSHSKLPEHLVKRTVRLSYVQSMLGAVYSASTGGMFIIGYALKLGADNVQIGLMSTVPMLCVVVQLFSALLVERGFSRRLLTISASILNVAGWALIILIPYIFKNASSDAKIAALIAIITLNTAFAYISGNARASWVGDIIPARTMGIFFGRVMMYAGIVGTVLALIEGTVLDHIKSRGIAAFNWLFLFGMVFGLLNVLLFVPQPDVRVKSKSLEAKYFHLIRDTFSNRSLTMVMLYGLVWSMQSLAAPFYATYMLRDLRMSFLGIGVLTGVSTVTVLLSSSFWGKVVDMYGSRPVLITCTAAITPAPLVWIWLTTAKAVYFVIPAINILAGFTAAGVSVALSALLYKVTPSSGRAMQFAIYSIVILLLVSPMPTIGGHLPGWLKSLGINADLRCTFYTSALFLLGATLVARRIHEPNSAGAREMVRNLPSHLRSPSTLVSIE